MLDPLKVAKDTRVKNLIGTCLSDMILRKVMNEPTALGMWKALKRDYQTKTLPNRIYLKQQFASFKMEESKSIEENMDCFLKLIADLSSLNNVSDEDQAIQLLTSLPSQYEALVHTLKYGTGKDTLTVMEITSSAYAKEIELKQKGVLNKGKSGSEGLYVESRGRSSKRSDKNDKSYRGRSKSKDHRSKSKPRANKDGKTACFICRKDGHWKRECPQRNNRHQSQTDSANAVTTSKKQQPLVLTVSTQDTKDEWVLDSGCSFHITPHRHVLLDFKEVKGGKVLMANNTQCNVEGIGKIKITNTDGKEVILTDVRYMPKISRNLISYGMLEKAGCNYKGEGFKIHFFKNGEKVFSGDYEDGLYYLQGTVSRAEANVVKAEQNMTELWNSRLGHMSTYNMNVLVKKGYLHIKEVGGLEFCENCALGKAHKQSFKKAKHITQGIPDYVHSDLWGSP